MTLRRIQPVFKLNSWEIKGFSLINTLKILQSIMYFQSAAYSWSIIYDRYVCQKWLRSKILSKEIKLNKNHWMNEENSLFMMLYCKVLVHWLIEQAKGFVKNSPTFKRMWNGLQGLSLWKSHIFVLNVYLHLAEEFCFT